MNVSQRWHWVVRSHRLAIAQSGIDRSITDVQVPNLFRFIFIVRHLMSDKLKRMPDTLQFVGSSINQLSSCTFSPCPRVFVSPRLPVSATPCPRVPASPRLFYSSASGRIVRISKIEIIGRNRRNRNSNVKKKPIVPTNIPQSHIVGWYIPHEEGK